ncbi:MAG: hypothetical protein WC668_01340 [Patescibacteria group bacterium]|jgi:hypothetical protein
MPDVNLLPEELRKKENEEQRRRISRTPSFDISLTNPEEIKLEKAGWLSRLFGKPVSPIVSSSRYQSSVSDNPVAVLPTFKSSAPANLPISEGVDRSNFYRQESKRLAELTSQDKKEESRLESMPASKAVASPQINQSSSKKGGWRKILASLFSRSGKVEPRIHLAKPSEATVSLAPMPIKFREEKVELKTSPNQPIKEGAREIAGVKIEPIKKEKKHKSSKYGGYHTTEPITHDRHTYINLIPSELLKGKAGGVNWFRVVSSMILPALVVFFCYLGMSWLQSNINQKISINRNELTQLQKSIGDYNERARINNDTANRVITLKKLLDNRIYWTKFFTLLEKYTLDGVYFKEFRADIAGLISLPATADNYETLARQLVVLKDANDFVKDARTTSMQVSTDPKAGVTGIDFLLRLTLADGVFRHLVK